MNYEEMSDFEINKAVSSKFRKVWTWKGKVYLSMTSTKPFDPCNNPNDAFPIIFENKISTSPTGDSWICGSSVFGTQTIDKNPLRSAMICFLKMRDAEK